MLADRLDATELMDDPALEAGTYQAVLADLARVNRITLAYRPTLSFLTRALGGGTRFSLLDVGFGDGDMLRTIARWARRRGIEARLTGIDLNPRSKAHAASKTPPGDPITYLYGDYRDLEGIGFDCIISSLVAHHMTENQLAAFVRFMEAEAALGWFVNDLHRHALAYNGWPLLAGLMRWHRIVRLDGRTSIARSFKPHEWQTMLASESIVGAKVQRCFPFRLCVQRLR